MANTIRTKEIGLHIISLLDAAGLSLVTAQLGMLEDYLGVEDITAILPAVLVAPIITDSEFRTIAEFRVIDTFRIIYAQEFATGQERVPIMLDKARIIVDAISATKNFPGLLPPVLPQVEVQFVSRIEWEPEENRFAGIAGTQIKAIAITETVRMVT
jgi:hypothetical protein